MNGIDAVAIATGNDFRALEAGAHSYAALKGKYTALTTYWKDEKGNLQGKIELPIAVGLVGGATKTHPIARIAVKILGVKTSKRFMIDVMNHPEFHRGKTFTSFIDDHMSEREIDLAEYRDIAAAAASAAAVTPAATHRASPSGKDSDSFPEPWATVGSWQIGDSIHE